MERNTIPGMIASVKPQIQVKRSSTIIMSDVRPSSELLNLYLKNLTHYKRKHHRCLSPELYKLREQ